MSAAFASSGFSTQAFSVQAFAFDTQKQPKRGGSSFVQDQVYFDLLGRAKIDQRDLLDIATIIGFLASRIDDL